MRTEFATLRIPLLPRNDLEYENKRRLNDPVYLDRFGYKVFSQNDEDGIIAEIFKRIGTTNKIFVEFGVQNGLESNGHFLLHKGWRGLWIEGSKRYCNQIKHYFERPIAIKQLFIQNVFITRENIDALIKDNILQLHPGVEKAIDCLSIDIDGNDYWIWEAIKCIKPRVVVIEYNAKFPPDFEWIMPYNPDHIWDLSDNQGASLKSLELLGEKLGYQLVATNIAGINAFFVQKEEVKDLFPVPATAENLYHPFCANVLILNGHPSRYYIEKDIEDK
jgi:hypothetical protein